MDAEKLFDGLDKLIEVINLLIAKNEALGKKVEELEKRVEELEKSRTGTYPSPLPGSPVAPSNLWSDYGNRAWWI